MGFRRNIPFIFSLFFNFTFFRNANIMRILLESIFVSPENRRNCSNLSQENKGDGLHLTFSDAKKDLTIWLSFVRGGIVM
jgi:hypothetical protein